MNALYVEQIKAKIGKLRIIQVAHLMTIPILVWVANLIPPADSPEWTLWHWVVTAFALYSVCVGFVLRRKLMQGARKALRSEPFNPKAVKQWQTAQLVSISLAEAPAVCGWVLQFFLGAMIEQAAPFYAAGLFLLLLWTPRMPTTALPA